jgi:hypothetical protein
MMSSPIRRTEEGAGIALDRKGAIAECRNMICQEEIGEEIQNRWRDIEDYY